tara:strand:+ start:908 stop:1696 length:789 start_codon:yes stop_codon:yes gene_type:complete
MPAPLLLLLTVLLGAPLSARADDLIVLLGTGSCPDCKLTDADLVHADLRDADLKAADLQRANLSRARLDGADLRDADLRFSSLKGASLRGADLRNSRLMGTDLSRADLTGALLDQHALDQSHWDGAHGVTKGARSHAGLHNAGVEAAQAGRWPEAEQLFNAAIKVDPDEPLSWVARGLSRGEQGKDDLASRDLAHAGQLFADQGDMVKADQLKEASQRVYEIPNQPDTPSGNGVGSALISGALSAAQALAPIALKALMPMIP